jgi:hypothetical protein
MNILRPSVRACLASVRLRRFPEPRGPCESASAVEDQPPGRLRASAGWPRPIRWHHPISSVAANGFSALANSDDAFGATGAESIKFGTAAAMSVLLPFNYDPRRCPSRLACTGRRCDGRNQPMQFQWPRPACWHASESFARQSVPNPKNLAAEQIAPSRRLPRFWNLRPLELERLTPLAMRDEWRLRERKDRDVGFPSGMIR